MAPFVFLCLLSMVYQNMNVNTANYHHTLPLACLQDRSLWFSLENSMLTTYVDLFEIFFLLVNYHQCRVLLWIDTSNSKTYFSSGKYMESGENIVSWQLQCAIHWLCDLICQLEIALDKILDRFLSTVWNIIVFLIQGAYSCKTPPAIETQSNERCYVVANIIICFCKISSNHISFYSHPSQLPYYFKAVKIIISIPRKATAEIYWASWPNITQQNTFCIKVFPLQRHHAPYR